MFKVEIVLDGVGFLLDDFLRGELEIQQEADRIERSMRKLSQERAVRLTVLMAGMSVKLLRGEILTSDQMYLNEPVEFTAEEAGQLQNDVEGVAWDHSYGEGFLQEYQRAWQEHLNDVEERVFHKLSHYTEDTLEAQAHRELVQVRYAVCDRIDLPKNRGTWESNLKALNEAKAVLSGWERDTISVHAAEQLGLNRRLLARAVGRAGLEAEAKAASVRKDEAGEG